MIEMQATKTFLQCFIGVAAIRTFYHSVIGSDFVAVVTLVTLVALVSLVSLVSLVALISLVALVSPLKKKERIIAGYFSKIVTFFFLKKAEQLMVDEDLWRKFLSCSNSLDYAILTSSKNAVCSTATYVDAPAQ